VETAVEGFEIHCGRTTMLVEADRGGEGGAAAKTVASFLRLERSESDDGGSILDGVTDGSVSGCYLHGLFASRGMRQGLLFGNWRMKNGGDSEGVLEGSDVPDPIDMLADHLCACGLDFSALSAMIRPRAPAEQSQH